MITRQKIYLAAAYMIKETKVPIFTVTDLIDFVMSIKGS